MEGGLIYQLFNLKDVEIILNILLVSSLPKNLRVWHYTKDGCFLVNSAYHLGMDCVSRRDGGRPSSSTYNGI